MASKLEVRMPRLAVIPGSSREGSLNVKLAKAAAAIAEAHGATTVFVDVKALGLPLYDQDFEAKDGMPAQAMAFKKIIEDADGLIVVSPEYNGFLPPLLLNAFTWASRGDGDRPMYATFKGKCAAVLSASPGQLGGMRAHSSVREILQNLGVSVLPSSVGVGGAYKAFSDSGELLNERQRTMAESTIAALIRQSRFEANYDTTCELIARLKEVPLAGEYGDISSAI